MINLSNNVALVTGASRGIGRATALILAQASCDVVIHYHRSADAAAATSAEIRALGRRALTVEADMRDTDEIQRLFQVVEHELGQVDVLVNNAAKGTEGSIISADLVEWRKTLEVNLISPMLLMRAAIPHMIKKGGGSIVNVSSLGSLRCIPNTSAYCTSKAALNALSQQAALDLGQDNIRCNVICPGFVYTEMAENGPLARMALVVALRRWFPSRSP